MATLRRYKIRSTAWGVADQAISSVTNFGILVLVARNVSPGQLGVFAIFIAAYSTVAFVNESLVAEPFVVRFTSTNRASHDTGLAAATGCSLGVGLALSLVMGVGAIAAGGSLRALLIVAALCAPGLLVQDTMRFAFFSGRRPRSAFLNDSAWAMIQGIGFTAVQVAGVHSLGMLVLTWAGAGAIAGGVALIQGGTVPLPLATRAWLRDHRDLWVFILPERLSGQGAMYVSLICIGGIAGLAAAAAIRSLQTLFGPLNILMNAARIVLLPSLVVASPERRRRRVHLLALGLTTVAALWGGVLMLIPASAGRQLLGATWPLVPPLIGLMTIDRIGAAAAEACRLGLVAASNVKRSFVARLIVAVAVIAGASIGSALGGAHGAVLAGAVVMPLGAALFYRQSLAATGEGTRELPRTAAERVEAELLA